MNLQRTAYLDTIHQRLAESPVVALVGLNHVSRVVCWRTSLQMRRVYAWRVVAPVSNDLAGGKWAMNEFIHHAMTS